MQRVTCFIQLLEEQEVVIIKIFQGQLMRLNKTGIFSSFHLGEKRWNVTPRNSVRLSFSGLETTKAKFSP